MAQTSIKNELAFGFPGAHGNGQPYVVDTVVLKAAVNFGSLVGMDGDGAFGPFGSTYSTVSGLAVGPHQHVRQVLPTETSSIQAPAGETIGVAKKGAWFIDVPEAATNAKVGGKVYYTADGALSFTATSNTLLGEILDFAVKADAVTGVLVRLA